MIAPAQFRRAIPDDARISTWHAPDGWPMRRFDWPADPGVPTRGRMLFQGGRGDIFEKYLEAFAHWHAQGWSITSLDWRGQGGSGRMTDSQFVGHIDDFATYIADFRAFWAQWSVEGPGPLALMGHSMGGHLVLRALVEEAATPDAAVLIAPMLGLHSPLGPTLGERLARVLGGVGNSSRPAWKTNERPATSQSRQALLTTDPDRYADELWWQKEKLELVMGPPSWHWVIQAFRSTRELRDSPKLRSMGVPVLMLVADADKLVNPKLARQTAARLRDARVVRFGKEAAHELLREADPVRNRALGEIDIFLASRAQAKSGAAGTDPEAHQPDG